MLRSRSFDLVNRRPEEFDQDDKKLPRLKGSYGADLYALEQDRAIRTEPEETSRRRTIRLQREPPESWGFTLQTYGIRNKKTGEVDVMSYVDYIDIHGSAWMSGMRTGDIILSVNGESVEDSTHVELVQRIQQCRHEMRLVVLFENCCRKVDLHERYLKLKKVLAFKLKEFRFLEEEERLIQKGIRLSRIDGIRYSNSSSVSSDWDIYSAVTSPTTLNDTPSNQFAFTTQSGVNNTSCDNLTLESSSLSDQWQPNASNEEICSSGPDLRDRCDNGSSFLDPNTTDFDLSGQSDISEASDSGLRKLYNITRCAQRISDAGRCDGILAFDVDESMLKNDGSMVNLIEDFDSEVREAKSTGQETSSSSVSPSFGNEKRSFFIESDSEDSNVTGELESRVLQDISSINNSSLQTSLSTSEEEKNMDCISDADGDHENASLFKHNVFQESNCDKVESETISNVSSDMSSDGTSSDIRKANDKNKIGVKSHLKTNIADRSSSCSSSSSSSGGSSGVSDRSEKTSGDNPRPSINQSVNTKYVTEKVISQHAFHPKDTSDVQRVPHSNILQSHSKHTGYNVQRSANKNASSSKRLTKRSGGAGVTPVLLSYKRDEDKNRIGQEDALKNNSNSNRLGENETCAEEHKKGAKITSTKISELNAERTNTPQFTLSNTIAIEKDTALGADDNKQTNRSSPGTNITSQEVFNTNAKKFKVGEDLSSRESDSSRSLSNASDSSTAEDAKDKLVQSNNNNNNNEQACNSYSKSGGNRKDDNKPGSNVSSKTLTVNMLPQPTSSTSKSFLQSSTSQTEQETKTTSQSPKPRKSTTPGSPVVSLKPSSDTAQQKTTSPATYKDNLESVKGQPLAMSDRGSGAAVSNTTNQNGRFIQGILVNNQTHSTRL